MAAIYIKAPRTLSATLLTRVVEHTLNLGVETRDDDGVKERVETCEDNRANNNGDDDLHARVNVAFCLVILAGLYALFNGVILPRLNTEIGEMFNYAG